MGKVERIELAPALETGGDIVENGRMKRGFSARESGYRVVEARSGEEAKELVQRKSFDMIFIEVKMPVMNCLESHMALRKIRSDVKVLMTTCYREGLEDLIDQALSESAHACIYKPFEAGKVRARALRKDTGRKDQSRGSEDGGQI